MWSNQLSFPQQDDCKTGKDKIKLLHRKNQAQTSHTIGTTIHQQEQPREYCLGMTATEATRGTLLFKINYQSNLKNTSLSFSKKLAIFKLLFSDEYYKHLVKMVLALA